MSLFDNIQDTAFDVVTLNFGYPAAWIPSLGGSEQTAQVLYKDETEKHGLSNVDFNIERYMMEYKRGDFEGLKAAIDAGGNESVSITTKEDVTLTFMVRRCETKYDGKTMIAYLNAPA